MDSDFAKADPADADGSAELAGPMNYRKQKGSRDGWEVTTATEKLSSAH